MFEVVLQISTVLMRLFGYPIALDKHCCSYMSGQLCFNLEVL